MNVHCNTLFILDGIKILVKKKKKQTIDSMIACNDLHAKAYKRFLRSR